MNDLSVYDVARVPPATMEQLQAYMIDRREPGDFVVAVLANDLKDAFGRADESNTRAMAAIVSFVYNHMPVHCQGSREKVKQWLADRPPEEPGAQRPRIHSV
jgi:hypothetical protein